jgi:hypothetical protein
MKIGFITSRDFYFFKRSGSSRLRADYMIRNWPEAELYRKGTHYDVLILQKVYKPSLVNKAGLTILDICDPDHRQLHRIVNKVDIVVCSSNALCEQYGGHYIPDRFDLDFVRHRKIHHDGPPRSAIWYGYRKHGKKLLPEFFDVLREYDIHLTVMSDKKPRFDFPFRWYKWPVDSRDPDMSAAHEIIINSDMVINPPLNPYKSDNKTHQAWLLNMPVAHTPEDVCLLSETSGSDRDIDINTDEYDIRRSVEQMKSLIKAATSLCHSDLSCHSERM